MLGTGCYYHDIYDMDNALKYYGMVTEDDLPGNNNKMNKIIGVLGKIEYFVKYENILDENNRNLLNTKLAKHLHLQSLAFHIERAARSPPYTRYQTCQS